VEVYIAWSNVHIGHGAEGSGLAIFEGWRGGQNHSLGLWVLTTGLDVKVRRTLAGNTDLKVHNQTMLDKGFERHFIERPANQFVLPFRHF